MGVFKDTYSSCLFLKYSIGIIGKTALRNKNLAHYLDQN